MGNTPDRHRTIGGDAARAHEQVIGQRSLSVPVETILEVVTVQHFAKLERVRSDLGA